MVRRLSDHAKLQHDGEYFHLDDILDREVEILSAVVLNGKFGKYALLEVNVGAEEPVMVRTTGFIVVDALERANEAHDFPILATFGKNGNTYRIE